MWHCRIQGLPIPENRIASLRMYDGDPRDTEQLQTAIQEDGYVLLRDALDKGAVLSARDEVFSRLAEVDEIRPPAIDGIATGTSRRRELAGDLNQFWKSVSEGARLRSVSHGTQACEIMQCVLGEPARPHDMMYLRPAAVDRCTRLHYDYPFFAGDSHRIVTVWIPLGDTPVTDGPLAVVEGSNRFDDLLDPIRDVDYRQDRSNDAVQSAAYKKQNETDPVTLVEERNTRLLTADFNAGDVVVFSGFLLHGSLDNQSTVGRVRLSCDVRYQPAADPANDSRYFGPDPKGSNGGGYGDMKGAKPLTDAWG